MTLSISDNPAQLLCAIEQEMLEVDGKTLFYPAADTDTTPFLSIFHPWLSTFHFCDLQYDGLSDRCFTLPDDFRIGEIQAPDPAVRNSSIETRQDGARPWRWLTPSSLLQKVTSREGHDFVIERRRGFGQYSLAEHGPASIGVFVHRSDSSGESGSNMYFLGNRPRDHEPVSRLWEKLDARLSDRAIVISDGCLTDFKFLKRASSMARAGLLTGEPRRHSGREWRPLGIMSDKPGTIVWSTVRL